MFNGVSLLGIVISLAFIGAAVFVASWAWHKA